MSLNLELELSHDGRLLQQSNPNSSFSTESGSAFLYETINHLVNYEELVYLAPERDAIQEILGSYATSPDTNSEQLLKLTGDFVIVMTTNNSIVTHIITSDLLKSGFYFVSDGEGIHISEEYDHLVPRNLSQDDFNPERLNHYDLKQHSVLGKTFLEHLSHSLPYTIYFNILSWNRKHFYRRICCFFHKIK